VLPLYQMSGSQVAGMKLDDWLNQGHPEVTMCYKVLTEDDVDTLVKIIDAGVVSLSLPWNGLGDDAAKKIAGAVKKSTTIKSLSLSNNKITDEGGLALAEAIEVNTSLKSFMLDFNKLSEEAIDAIMAANAKRETPMENRLGGIFLKEFYQKTEVEKQNEKKKAKQTAKA